MVAGCTDVGGFVVGGGDGVLFNPGIGICDKFVGWLAIPGDWVAVYVATSCKYWAIDWWDRIKNRMEMEKIIITVTVVAVFFISLFLSDFVV